MINNVVSWDILCMYFKIRTYRHFIAIFIIIIVLYLAVVKHVNKRIQLNYYVISRYSDYCYLVLFIILFLCCFCNWLSDCWCSTLIIKNWRIELVTLLVSVQTYHLEGPGLDPDRCHYYYYYYYYHCYYCCCCCYYYYYYTTTFNNNNNNVPVSWQAITWRREYSQLLKRRVYQIHHRQWTMSNIIFL
jgi:hypothetical protein